MLNRKRVAALCLGLIFSLFVAACGDSATISVSNTTAASTTSAATTTVANVTTSSVSRTDVITTTTTRTVGATTAAAGAGSSSGGATNVVGLPFPPYSGLKDVPIDPDFLEGITVGRRNINQFTDAKSALYTTGDSLDKVLGYYRETSKKLGYVVVQEKTLAKKTDTDAIYVKAESGGKSSIIMVSYFGQIDATTVRIWQSQAIKVGDNLVLVIAGAGTLPAVPKP